MGRYTVDRLEDQGWAVLEDAQAGTLRIPLAWLPSGTAEGDVIAMSEERQSPGVRVWRLEVDTEGKEERLKETQRLRTRLQAGPKGDISL